MALSPVRSPLVRLRLLASAASTCRRAQGALYQGASTSAAFFAFVCFLCVVYSEHGAAEQKPREVVASVEATQNDKATVEHGLFF